MLHILPLPFPNFSEAWSTSRGCCCHPHVLGAPILPRIALTPSASLGSCNAPIVISARHLPTLFQTSLREGGAERAQDAPRKACLRSNAGDMNRSNTCRCSQPPQSPESPMHSIQEHCASTAPRPGISPATPRLSQAKMGTSAFYWMVNRV